MAPRVPTRPDIIDELASYELNRLEEAHLLRSMRIVTSAQASYVEMDGRRVLLMCSNDYLGYANHPDVIKAAHSALERWGAGAGASRLVSGTMGPHVELEETIARFKGTEAALVFNSGYHANLGCITTIAGRDTEIFSDRLNHASIVDACILSRARVTRYPNRDMDSLERLLRKSTAKEKLIVTDGVFSMDGTVAPIADIKGLAERFGAMLYVDDAHGTGVLGEGGRGTLEELGVDGAGVIQMGTLGKALGSFGAFIAGSKNLVRLMASKARPFVYTTALPPSVCAASVKAIELAETNPAPRQRVRENAARLMERLGEAGLDTLGSTTQIIPVLTKEPEATMRAAFRLLEGGVFIQGIRPPTVPEGASRLRATVTAAHTAEDIDRAAEAIIEAVQSEDAR